MGTVKYSGPVASFHCPTEAEIRSLKVHFSPKQLGEGTPSPENVRAIEGWDGVTVHNDVIDDVPRYNIPLDYQRVEYIDSKDGAYFQVPFDIDTNQTLSVQTKLQYIGTSNNNIWLAGDGRVINGTQFEIGIYSGSWYTPVGATKQIEIIKPADIITQQLIIISLSREYTAAATLMWRLFGHYGFEKGVANTRIYFLNIHIDNTPIYNFIPCRRKSDNKPGMYDTVSGQFFTNQGTGEFICGPDVGQTTEYEFGVLGKNKFDKDNVTNDSWIRAGNLSEENPLGSIKENASGYTLSSYIPVHPNTVYTIKYNASSLATAAGMVFFSEQNANSAISGISLYYQTYVNSSTTREYYTFTTPDNCHYLRISTPPNASDIQLELGSSATTYEPYNPNHTVYGGWVDLITGEVCQEWTEPLTLGEPYYYGGNVCFGYTYPSKYTRYSTNLPSERILSALNKSTFSINTKNTFIFGYDSTFEKTDGNGNLNPEWTEWYNSLDTKPTISLQLYEPITYHLAPTSMQTFLSQNNIWSNADYVEVEYDLHETQTILARKQFIIANQPHIVKSVAAPLQNFVTDVAAPLKECKIYFTPVQEGTGDPSPDNVRPISGWTGVEMYRTGKNMLDELFLSDLANYPIKGNYGYWYTDPIFLKQNTTYKFSFATPQTYETTRYWAVKVYDDAYTDINDTATVRYLVNNTVTVDWSITTGAQGVIRFAVYGGQATLDDIWNNTTVQLELGSTATSYESYSGTTLPIDWTTEAGTIYGGYVDLVTGEVVAEYILMEKPWSEWTLHGEQNNTTRKYTEFNVDVYDSSQYSQDSKISNIAKYSYNWTQMDETHFYFSSSRRVYMWLPIGTDESTVVQVVGHLITPIRYTLTPTQLKTLRGTNNIWSNSNGDITVQFWRH